MRCLLKYLLVVLHLNTICWISAAYVSVTDDPTAWAKNFSEATQEQRQDMYRQSVEEIARAKVGGVWDTVVNVITRDKRLTANELLARLNDNLHTIPSEYQKAISFVTVMKALDSFTEKEQVPDNAKKVETMAKVFSVPPEVAKKLHLKQLIKSHSALTKYPNVVQAADAFITTEKSIALDMPKMYEPARGVKLIDTELVQASQKLSEVAPDPLPKVPVVPESSPKVQDKPDSKPSKSESIEEKKEEPKQEEPKKQTATAGPRANEQVSRLLSELNSRDALIKELQEKMSDIEKQPKEFRPHLINTNNELENQVEALKGAIVGKDSSIAQLTRERATEKGHLEAQLQQSQKHLGDQQAKNQSLQSQIDQRGRDLGAKEADIRKLTTEKSDLETRLQTTGDQLIQSQQDLGDQRTQNQDLQRELGAKDVANRQLTENLQQTRQSLTDTQNQNRNLQDQVDQQNRQVQDLQQGAKSKDATISTLGAELNKRDTSIGTLQTSNQALKDQVTQKDTAIAQLNQAHAAEKSTWDARLQLSETQVQGLGKDLGEQQVRNQNLQNQIDQRGHELRAKDVTINTLGGQLNLRDADIRKLTTEKGDLGNQLQATRDQLTQSQRDLGNQQTQNQNLQNKIDQRDRELGAREVVKHQLAVDLQQSRQDLATKEASISTLKTQLTQKDIDIAQLNQAHAAEKSALETQLQTTGGQLTQSQLDLGNQQVRNQNLQSQIDQRGHELRAKDVTINTLGDQLNLRDADIRKLTAEKGDLGARLQTTADQLTQSLQDLTDQRTQNRSLTDQVSQRDQRIQALQQSVTKKDVTINTLGDQLSLRDADIRKLTAARDAFEVQWQQSKKDLADMRAWHQDLQNEFSQREQIIEGRDNTIGQLNGEKRTLQAQNQTLQNEVAQRDNDLRAQEVTNRQLATDLQQSRQELTNFQGQVRNLQSQNQDLQLKTTQLSIVAKQGRSKLLETVGKILSNRRYLNLLCYKKPQVLMANAPQPVQDIRGLLGPIIEQCEEIYNHGTAVDMAGTVHRINNFNDWIELDNIMHQRLSQKVETAKLIERSFNEIQRMLTRDFQNKDVEVFLREILGSPEHFTDSQQQTIQHSLEFFMTRVNECESLVNAIENCNQEMQTLTVGIQQGYGVWQPPSETAKELGVAVLKTCQLMHFCQMPFRALNQIIQTHLQGNYNKENVLLAFRQIKMKFYVLSVLKLAHSVASSGAGMFGAQPPINSEQLKNMASTLKDLALQDVILTNADWFLGCRCFTDPCPAQEKIGASWAKAEEIFQKIHKPIMDEKCFLQMLLSHKLKDLL
ncbi:MAG: hypothetical protein LBJ78_01330 [Puniceicoccales bacterium]|jgi:SMC interacting uncharacterized protein involved in chromosome segregation|nr:hypothetical protein [Puniceicoccales bacterium]